MKKAVLFLGMFLFLGSLEAKESLTCIGQYMLSGIELHACKVFVNDTGRSLMLAWQASAQNSDVESLGHVIIEPNCSYGLDLSKLLVFFRSKGIKSYDNYVIKLSVGKALNFSGKFSSGLNCRALKRSENGLLISKNDFLVQNSFILKKTKKGKIFYEVTAHG